VDRLDSYEEMFRHYYAPLCNYVNSYIKDWDLSQDIVQTTFLKLWNNKESWQTANSQKSYVFRAVKNTLLDRIKKDERKLRREELYNEISQNLESTLDGQIIRHEILKSLEKLKPKIRKIFTLNKMEGLTYAEIAQYLDISERSVEDNMAKALRALRKDLANNDFLMK
jgi:RNA polymerase sigma-70 factor (ECF subfamily)